LVDADIPFNIHETPCIFVMLLTECLLLSMKPKEVYLMTRCAGFMGCIFEAPRTNIEFRYEAGRWCDFFRIR